MTQEYSYLNINFHLKIDYYFGYRGWGLILYGTMPSSLVALGVIKVANFDIHTLNLLIPFLLVAVVPTLIIFLLIHQRLEAWYLLNDGIWMRSTFVTISTISLSTLISWATGLITGRYVIISWEVWRLLDINTRLIPIVESLLLTIIVLIGSSTLFLTAIKETGGLPTLPSSDFVIDIKSLKDILLAIQHDPILQKKEGGDSEGLLKNLEIAISITFRLAYHSYVRFGRQDLYEKLNQDLRSLRTAVRQESDNETKWIKFFSPVNPDIPLNDDEKKWRKAVQKLRKARLYA